ncbi:MAG: OmpA family protein [Flavobacterium sp.]|uniref:OmpA family protein n=1 Tax=Flavobacterium sp. TaxID=239 RepID=UPI0022C3864F|nr:OmpA family protein [Flavobacterium sp.]MCZ8198574.1 OmpA family protein [Flavobacterium sp.]
MKTKLLFIYILLQSVFSFSQEQFVVYFESNKHEMAKKENKKLQDWMLANKEVKIVAINGYTDEDGTSGFNDTLAKKRVNFIFNQIKDKIKIREDFKTRSFGENFKQSTNKAENRKVTIYYLLEKDLAKEDEILGIKKEEIAVEPKKEINYPKELIIENPDGSRVEYKLNVEFMKLIGNSAVGDKLKIDNLNFVINTFAVVNESRSKLYELLLVMQNNPKLKIELQGHLCCMTKDRVDLSTQRSKAISNFLRQNGIESSRVAYKGFGVSQPLFPIPEKNEAERAANRRVEILILEN